MSGGENLVTIAADAFVSPSTVTGLVPLGTLVVGASVYCQSHPEFAEAYEREAVRVVACPTTGSPSTNRFTPRGVPL